MQATGWTWKTLLETPEFVRRYTWDFLVLRDTAQREARERGKR
jgi:hypothetical protein